MNIQKLFGAKLNRRRLLGNLGMMGAGAVITACGGGMAQDDDDMQPVNRDPAILNFALNLEYLEAAFYLAAVGRIDEITSIGGNAAITLPTGFDGSTAIEGLSSGVRAYADELANEELAHVQFLRTALGDAAADRPVLDLNTSFQAAATAALAPIPEEDRPFAGSDFNPFANEPFFLHGSFIFEDVGVTAYKGAAPLITSKDTLDAAAGILVAEAYHSGTIRTTLYAAAEAGAYDGLPIFTIVDAISNARDALAGTEGTEGEDDGKDQPINGANVEGDLATSADANISVTDANGIAFSRTPREVANIVFLDATGEALMGGFFPNGLSVPAGLESDFEFLLSIGVDADA